MIDHTDAEIVSSLYHDGGYSMEQIADWAGVSTFAVSYWMDKHGIDRREPGEKSPSGKRSGLRGESNKNSKLTESDVREMREKHREGVSQSELARRYGIADSTAHQIITRKTWTHVD